MRDARALGGALGAPMRERGLRQDWAEDQPRVKCQSPEEPWSKQDLLGMFPGGGMARAP